MHYKILTVDDSKTVRIIVRNAFKGYDCEIIEAGNGVEGLALAAKEMPDIILLDVIMPVMDGVEMLTKLKSAPALNAIPVVMLTAEGGRDHLLKLAKIGVRDYLVKPFKKDVLIERVGCIIDLKPLSDAPTKIKSILDSAEILVVSDKPVIIQQIQEGLKHTPWNVHGVAAQGEAIDFCTRTPPDVIVVSLSLPEESAFKLFRLVRTNVNSKYTPVFALVVKTEVQQQQQAQTLGFSAIITLPIDLAELDAKMAKAMNLDTSQRYFAIEGDSVVMRLPENCSAPGLAEAAICLKPGLANAVASGLSKAVIDLQALKAMHMGVIKLLFQAMQTCRDLGIHFAFVGNPQIIAECKSFDDTRGLAFYDSLDEAKAKLGKTPAA